jgi:hypothetical protein
MSSSADSLSVLYDSLTSQSSTRPGPVLQFWTSLRASISPSVLFSYLRDLYRSENWRQIVFLTTVAVAMAGCGFLSALLRRARSSEKKAQLKRPTVRKSSTNSSTSSDDDYEDEEYDSNESFRHNNDLSHNWPSEPQEQTSDGM